MGAVASGVNPESSRAFVTLTTPIARGLQPRDTQACAAIPVGQNWSPLIMQRIHIRPLADEELRPQLEAGATIYFDGQTIQWQEVERQVERLGFGDLYSVSSTQGPLGNNCKISLKPRLAAGSTGQKSGATARVARMGQPHQPSL